MASDRDGLGWHLAVRYYDPWREAVDERCDERFRCELTNFGPPGRETANYFYWMATLRELGHEAVMNIMIALVVSYVVLVMVMASLSPLIGSRCLPIFLHRPRRPRHGAARRDASTARSHTTEGASCRARAICR